MSVLSDRMAKEIREVWESAKTDEQRLEVSEWARETADMLKRRSNRFDTWKFLQKCGLTSDN